MTDVLEAGSVVVTDEDEMILVGFADDELETLHYLTLQRSHEYDAQDVTLGMNQVHIERNDQFRSAYGGIERFELRRDRALLRLSDAAAVTLGGANEIEVRFDVDDARFEELRAGLRRVFEGTDVLVEADGSG